MTSRPTISEITWPDDADDANVAVEWALNVATQVLDWTWRAFDQLRDSHLSQIDFTSTLEQVERDLVRLHFIEIQRLWGSETCGLSSVHPVHEWPELESRSSARAKPPSYDLAFVAATNRRWVWPLEAKVVCSAEALSEYMDDVNRKFIAGIAAPRVGEGAMIGYLRLVGVVTEVFRNLSERLGQSLEDVPEFQHRPHRVSHHTRAAAPPLRLHHLLMVVCVH